MSSRLKVANGPSDVPEGHHFAILIFKSESVHVPGDERSRTNPGHGYPAHTETFNSHEYHYTLDRAEWISQIEKYENANKLSTYSRISYAAIEVAAKASIKTTVVVGVETK